jgi:hypothetical protein
MQILMHALPDAMISMVRSCCCTTSLLKELVCMKMTHVLCS